MARCLWRCLLLQTVYHLLFALIFISVIHHLIYYLCIVHQLKFLLKNSNETTGDLSAAMVTDTMDNSNNEVPRTNNVTLLAYQRSPPGKENAAVPPLATAEESPPTPPPPLPPPPLSLTPPPRPTETHPGQDDNNPNDETNETAKLNKSDSNHDALLVKDSSRPKPVRGTTHLVSNLYAKLLVAATAVLVSTEILPNDIPLFFYHGYMYTFLIGAAILCIVCIYFGLILQKCPGVEELEELDQEDPETESVLRRGFYPVPEISIFFRVGALVFGLGTLIAIGLETATLFTLERPCMDKLNFVQPILHGLFTLMQMHFLSLNSQRAVRNLGWFRHIVLMHLVAANIAVWMRLVVWETAKSWLDDSHSIHNASEKWPPPGFNMTVHAKFSDGRHGVYFSPSCVWIEQDEEKMEDILALRHCYQNTTIGSIWDKAQPFIFPFIVQYCLVGATVNYVLWGCMSHQKRRITRKSTSWTPKRDDVEDPSSSSSHRKVDCKGSSKGLFLGLLVLAVGIVVLILFFVLTNNKNLRDETLFIMITVHCAILGISALGILFGICRVQDMCTDYTRKQDLHDVLQSIGVIAVYVHGVCSLVVGSTDITNTRHIAVFVDGALMIVQSLVQSVFFHKISQKCCTSKCAHQDSRPGRQIVTFLAFTNLVLWVTESFTDQNHVSSQLQLQFFGVIPWGLVSRILLPLVVFYRFHSSVYLMETWKTGYNMDN